MNELLVSSLLVLIFALNAFCMNPSNWSPPAPENVAFGECLFVPEITGGGGLLDEINYSYRHICRQKFPQDGPQPSEQERNWYFVGSLKRVGADLNLSAYNYVPIEQGLIQFKFLNGMTVKFALRLTATVFKVTFQSAQQRQAFYGMVYRNVVLTKAALNKIGLLHEITIREDGKIGHHKKIGRNIEALREGINDFWYLTLRNEQGEPIIIFSQTEASIMCMRTKLYDKLQLLLQAHGTFYILTFPNCAEAEKFSVALLGYIPMLHLDTLDPNLVHRFKYNSIAMDS